jgi:hypothetical protein
MLGNGLMGHARAAARLLPLLPLLALLAGCGGLGESRTIQIAERPQWTAGDSWTYRGKGRDGAYTITRREIESGASQEFWYSSAVRGWVKVRGTDTAGGTYEEELTAYSSR